jgi:nucleotide-binding universal stress UspA family protein
MKVLVAIEDKDDAAKILETIQNRGWPDATEFVLVHVLDTRPALEFEDRFELVEKEIEGKSRSAFKLLLDTSEKLKSILPHAGTNLYVCCGNATEEILAAINDLQPQVVVIGKHCRNKLQNLFHKSVSERVLQRIPKDLDAVHVVEVPPLTKAARVDVAPRRS